MAERIEIDDELLTKLRDRSSFDGNGTFRLGGRDYTLIEPAGNGKKAVVWKVHDSYGRPKAARFAIYDDYSASPWEREATRAAQLWPYEQFAQFEYANVVRMLKQQLVCFVEEWVDGQTLSDFLCAPRNEVTTAFLMLYVRELCAALSALQGLSEPFMHDDLHSGNVMIARTPKGHMGGPAYSVRVIDTGSLKPLKEAEERGDDERHTEDHVQFVGHLAAIVNTIRARGPIAPRDRRFLDECDGILRSMLEPDRDLGIALRDPEQIVDQFELAYARSDAIAQPGNQNLLDPFEYITAERMSSDELLLRVFAETPWLDRVSGPDMCLVSGPRGCGKSTVFRWLSLKAHLNDAPEDLDARRIIGFYVGCGGDFENRLGWISTTGLAEKYRKEVIHYFNLLVVHEVLHTLALVADQRPELAERWGLGRAAQQAICGHVRSQLDEPGYVVQGVSRLRQVVDTVEREMTRCHLAMLRGSALAKTTPASFLGDFTELVSKAVPFFADRTIAILLDDYSTHRIPSSIQVILNPIVWTRRNSYAFKVSSEKYGLSFHDERGATADVARDMIEVDFGSEYLGLYDSDQLSSAREFARRLLERRLDASDYQGSPEGLLGKSEWKESSLARALRVKKKGARRSDYHGLECIADLCSGDVAALLAVYRKIFQLGAVTKSSTERVPSHIQHEAIMSVSRQQLDAVRHHHPYGDEMYAVAHHYGTLVRQILDECDLIVSGKPVPAQVPRIEIDQPNGSIMDDYSMSNDADSTDDAIIVEVAERLSAKELALAHELVRRSVFIELEPGSTRHGNYPSLRWHFRRLLMPAFHAALSKNDAIKWNPSQFRLFLNSPKEACEKEFRRRRKPEPPSPESLFRLDEA